VKYSPDGKHLVTGSRDARLKFWNVESGYEKEDEIVAHMYAINHLDYSPDTKHFVTCSLDKTLKVWDASGRKLLKVVDRARHGGHVTSVNKVLWTDHQNQILSASDDRTISVWHMIF
jgi:WD40 repeat protein